MATIQEVLTAIVQDSNGYVSTDLAELIASLGEPAPVPEATPAPAPPQPSEADTPNPAFGSETEPVAADPDTGPDPFNVSGQEAMGG